MATPITSPFDYWAARYQDEGRLAGPHAPNPYTQYRADSMAATRFAKGQAEAAIQDAAA